MCKKDIDICKKDNRLDMRKKTGEHVKISILQMK